MSRPKVVVLTQIPSPYQVEFFNAIHHRGDIDLTVLYVQQRDSSRSWEMLRLQHDHIFLTGSLAAPPQEVLNLVRSCDLCVFGWYSDAVARKCIAIRTRQNRSWVLWGERPRQTLGWLSRLRRRALLPQLFTQPIPIWGIGSWAVTGWINECGNDRLTANVPYFSDLGRFQSNGRVYAHNEDTRTILYVGSLSYRKGVDLLATAFVRVADRFPHLRLRFVGDGPLRSSLERSLHRLRERVEFAGFAPWSDLPAAYRTGDILCAPSRYDGWGLVVPEGLASGLPVISSDATGAAIDLIEVGHNGWITRAGKLDSLVEALRRVASMDDDELRSAAVFAQQSVAAHSLEHGVAKFSDATKQVCH